MKTNPPKSPQGNQSTKGTYKKLIRKDLSLKFNYFSFSIGHYFFIDFFLNELFG